MADQPEANQSIAEGRSKSLLASFLLPLLALCNCGRKDNDEVTSEEVCQSIDKQPGGRSMPEEPEEDSGAYAPTYFEARHWSYWKDHNGDNSDSLAQSIDEAEPTPKSKAIESTQSTIESTAIESTQLTLADLPLLPLLTICRYLRKTDDSCENLDSFRKTCSIFAGAVNAFLKNPLNPSPPIAEIQTTFHEAALHLWIKMDWKCFFLHPLCAIQDVVDSADVQPHKKRPKEQVAITYSISYEDHETIEMIAQMLRGFVGMMYIRFFPGARNFNSTLKLLRNLVIDDITCYSLPAREIGSYLVNLLRQQKHRDFYLQFSYKKKFSPPANVTILPSDFWPLFSQLVYLSCAIEFRHKRLHRSDHRHEFFGQPLSLWQDCAQQLMRKERKKGKRCIFYDVWAGYLRPYLEDDNLQHHYLKSIRVEKT